MKRTKPDQSEPDDLRIRAEQALPAQVARRSRMPSKEMQKLVRELQVHQIELELQNEKLCRSQSALQTAAARYADLYDFSPAGHFSLDRKGVIQEANRQAGILLGMSREELIRQPMIRFIVPNDQAVFARHLQDVFRTGTRQSCELRLCQSGDVAPMIHLESQAYPDEAGTPTYCRIALLDITRQKRADDEQQRLLAELDQSKQHFERIFRLAPSAVAISTLPEGRFLDVNDGLVRLTGYERAELIGHTTVELNLWADPSERPRVLEEIRQQGFLHNREGVLRTKAGGLRHVMIAAEPIRMGDQACLIYVAHDITAWKQAEEVRRKSEQLEAGQKRVLELIAKDAPLSTALEALVGMIEEQSATRMFASILLVDADGLHLYSAAAPSLPEAYNRAIDGVAIGPNIGSCGTAAYRRRPVYVSDIATNPLWADFAALALSHGLRACWSTPILSSTGRLLGTFAMYYPDVREPNEDDLRYVEVATRIAAIAIERRRAEDALRLAKFSVERAADAVYWIDSQAKILDVNEAASRMLSYSKEELRAMTVHDLNPDFQADMWPGFWAETQRRGTMVIETAHRAKNGRLIPIEVSVNFLIHEGKEYHCAFVRDITERKRAEGRLRDTLDRLRKLSQRMESIREEARSRIARELHDELGVRLTCLKLDLARLQSLTRESVFPRETMEEKIRSMTAEVDATIAAVQRLVAELRPGILDDLGLVAAIDWQCRDFERRSGIRCFCEATQEMIDLDPSCATAAFRIFQETLTNVLRHAKATFVRVLVTQVNGDLLLEIQDDGQGISAGKVNDSASLGLLGMRERASSLGGQFEIAGWPGKGTTVTVRLPLAGSEKVLRIDQADQIDGI